MTLKSILISSTEAIEAAELAIRQGDIVSYPTETFYALGADPYNETALKKLFKLKGRSFSEPISVIISDIDMLDGLVKDVPSQAVKLIEEFWPGPLTIVFKAAPIVSKLLTAGRGTIGVRVPGAEYPCALSAAFGGPITATSANPSGARSPVSAREVENYFGSSIELIVDGGHLPGTRGSTIVDVSVGGIRIIRAGEIEKSRIEGL